MNKRKLFQKARASSHNIHFKDMRALAEAFGFRLARVKGSHHIFAHPDIQEFVNLQNEQGYAKAYQVRQFLSLVEEYSIRMQGDEPGGQ